MKKQEVIELIQQIIDEPFSGDSNLYFLLKQLSTFSHNGKYIFLCDEDNDALQCALDKEKFHKPENDECLSFSLSKYGWNKNIIPVFQLMLNHLNSIDDNHNDYYWGYILGILWDYFSLYTITNEHDYYPKVILNFSEFKKYGYPFDRYLNLHLQLINQLYNSNSKFYFYIQNPT